MGRIDGVHDVVERPGHVMDVFTVDRRDERLVQPLDQLVSQEVALVLDLFDLVRLLHQRRIGGEHLVEKLRADADLLRHRNEVVVELFFTRDKSESRHSPGP